MQIENPRAIACPDCVPEDGVGAGRGAGGSGCFDVFVIGTGGAGVAAAIQAAGMGVTVAIGEGGTLGGTCVNTGCIPSKYLVEAAARYHEARRGFPGIAPCDPALDWRALVARKAALVDELRRAKYADVLAGYPGVTVLDGYATLTASAGCRDTPSRAGAPLRVRAGGTEHLARKVIVATGGAPGVPPIPGLDSVGVLDSTTATELDELPASMLVLGGSAVGLELGQTFARFGVDVTIVEIQDRILPGEEQEISQALRGYLEADGVTIHTGVQAVAVERQGDGTTGGVIVRVRRGMGGTEWDLRADRILVAAGRRPNTRGLGLEGAGVALAPSGHIRVDTAMRTSNPDVYAAGDVTGGPGYVYVAAAGGRIAAENAVTALGGDDREARSLDLSLVPGVTFTSPQAASVGLTESAARAAGHTVEVSVLDMAQVPRAIVSHDTRGLVKVVAESGSGRLLGVHALAPSAGELMGEAALAIRSGLSARELGGMLHSYLTWGESLKLAAQGFAADVSRLSCCA